MRQSRRWLRDSELRQLPYYFEMPRLIFFFLRCLALRLRGGDAAASHEPPRYAAAICHDVFLPLLLAAQPQMMLLLPMPLIALLILRFCFSCRRLFFAAALPL